MCNSDNYLLSINVTYTHLISRRGRGSLLRAILLIFQPLPPLLYSIYYIDREIHVSLILAQGVKFLYIPIFSYIFGHFLFSPIFQRNSYFFLYFRGFIVVRAITFHEIMHILPVLVETFFDLLYRQRDPCQPNSCI